MPKKVKSSIESKEISVVFSSHKMLLMSFIKGKYRKRKKRISRNLCESSQREKTIETISPSFLLWIFHSIKRVFETISIQKHFVAFLSLSLFWHQLKPKTKRKRERKVGNERIFFVLANISQMF